MFAFYLKLIYLVNTSLLSADCKDKILACFVTFLHIIEIMGILANVKSDSVATA